jgi:hypothetical protein
MPLSQQQHPDTPPRQVACDVCAPLVSALESRLAEMRTASGRAIAASEADEEGAVNKLLRAVSQLRADRQEAELQLQAESEFISNKAARVSSAARTDAAIARAERDAAFNVLAATEAAALSRATSPTLSLSSARAETEKIERASEAETEFVVLRMSRSLESTRMEGTARATAVSYQWREALEACLSKGGVIDAATIAAISADVDLRIATDAVAAAGAAVSALRSTPHPRSSERVRSMSDDLHHSSFLRNLDGAYSSTASTPPRSSSSLRRSSTTRSIGRASGGGTPAAVAAAVAAAAAPSSAVVSPAAVNCAGDPAAPATRSTSFSSNM